MNNFSDFRVAFLHSKFWTHNGILVPNTKVILNEDFVDWHNLLRVPAQIQHFKVFWFAKGVSGEICIPGQWNYAYIDGKFYHLVKMHSNGFVKGIEDEWFYYNVVYDDWQNDWMNNTFYLKGTLELTGDPELVKQHIHQMSPIIENVNGYRFLNGVKKTEGADYITELILPKEIPINMKLEGMSSADKVGINDELRAFHERGELLPRDEKLWIPFMYRCDDNGNWKWSLLQQIRRHQRAGFKVYDVTVESNIESSQVTNFRNRLEIMLGSNELYLLSSDENRVFSFAKAMNPTKWCKAVDLSGCTDITVLDNLTLAPLYTVDKPEPKFSIREFVDKICNRQGWPSDYKDEMVELFEEIVIPRIAPILGFNDDRDTKVFRDVTLEPIQRDVVGRDHLGNDNVKNPEWINWSDTRIVGEKNHKNFIWDNIGARVNNGFNPYLIFFSTLKTTKDDFKDDEQLNKFKDSFRRYLQQNKYSEAYLSGWERNFYNLHTLLVSPSLSLVYDPWKYKLTSQNDITEYLDFSRNTNEFKRWIMLLPDYDRKTHVLATNGLYSYTDATPNKIKSFSLACIDDWKGLKYDPKDPKAIERTQVPINGKTCSLIPFPVIFDEIEDVKDTTVTIDWERPSTELLFKYLRLNNDNRDEGARLLTRGYAFMALNGRLGKHATAYSLLKKDWKAKCNNKNYCDIDEWFSEYPDPYHAASRVWAYRPNAQYTQSSSTKEWDWREFQTEMSFPVKADTFNILDILREYDDIPDNFLRWEVINTNVKKGKIKKYMRSFWHTNKSSPGCYRYGKEQEAKVPKNTVVMIWICTRETMLDDGEGYPDTWEADKKRDKEALDKYNADTGKLVFEELGKLLYKLNKLFFLTKWELGGESGAIPSRQKNETSVTRDGDKIYPKYNGQSQLSLGYCKPHQGMWYVAWTRFYAPEITNPFRFTESGKLDFNKKGHNDWFMSMLPDTYERSGDYKPKFTYREGVTNISTNNLLCFLTSIFDDRSDINNLPKVLEDPSWLYSLRKWSNKDKDAWIKDAEWVNKRFERCFYNNDRNLILDEYIFKHKTYTTRRTDNPKKLPETWRLIVAPRHTYIKTNQSPFDKEVPPFVIKYLDPNQEVCVLHGWERNNAITKKSDRIQLYRDKLNELATGTMISLESWNQWIKFEGTNWYASIKLNTKGNTVKWDYELFTNEIGAFLGTETEKWNFVNHKEPDVDVIINTRNEINIYGNKFPLKSRRFEEGDELDFGLHVKALDDVKQTQAAAWYSVQMNLNDQDILSTFIETPKELTKYSGYTAYERERMIREIGLRGEEYIYNKQMLEYQREENKFTNQYEKDWLYKEWKYDVARGATQIVGGVLDVATGGAGLWSAAANAAWEMALPPEPMPWEMMRTWNIPGGPYGGSGPGLVPITGGTMRGRANFPAIRDDRYYRKRYFNNVDPNIRQQNLNMLYRGSRSAGRAMGGAMGIVGGGLTIAEAYETFNIKDEYRKQKYALAEQKLATEGDMLNKRHEFERKNLLNDLWAMSANVHYPQLNANIVYKLYNRHIGIGDIHMVQYYPKGRLLEYIKEYYREFGYNIMVRNFECTGITDVKNHLRFQFIYEIGHPNICVQEMIRARALAGIKVIPWIQ